MIRLPARLLFGEFRTFKRRKGPLRFRAGPAHHHPGIDHLAGDGHLSATAARKEIPQAITVVTRFLWPTR
jgi:hypothetical protein